MSYNERIIFKEEFKMERTLLKLALAISLGMAFGGKNNVGNKKKKKHKKEPDIILVIID